MIKPICDLKECQKELTEFGGMTYSPPYDGNKVDKYHICKDCFEKIIKPMVREM